MKELNLSNEKIEGENSYTCENDSEKNDTSNDLKVMCEIVTDESKEQHTPKNGEVFKTMDEKSSASRERNSYEKDSGHAVDNSGKEMVRNVMAKKVHPSLEEVSDISKKVLQGFQSEIQFIPLYDDLQIPEKFKLWQMAKPPVSNISIPTKSTPKKINGNFFFNSVPSILYYNKTPFINGNVKIIDILVRECECTYVCEVNVDGDISIENVAAEDFSNLKWLKKVQRFTFLCNRNEIADLSYRYSQFLILNTKADIKTYIFKTPGWRELDGKLCYLTPQGVIGQKIRAKSQYGQSFSSLSPTFTGFRRYLDCIHLTKSPVAAIIILFFALSLSFQLFKSADLVPKFLLFLEGRRGSRKTSLSLALTSIQYSNAPKYTLKATPAALESGLRDYFDAVMLIDDLAPTHELGDLRHLRSNLELMTRIFGDANGKQRCLDYSKNPNVSQYVSQGGCILTGEFISGCESSLARTLILKLDKDDVNLELLTNIQHNKKYVENFAVDYIYHLTRLMEEKGSESIIIDLIQKKGFSYRRSMENRYTNARYNDDFALLKTTVDLLMEVARYGNLLSQNEIEYYYNFFDVAIKQVIGENSNSLSKKSPDNNLINAITYAIESGRFPVVQLGTSCTHQNKILDDEKSYYMTQATCSLIYEDYLKTYKISSSQLSPKEVGDILVKLGIVEEIKEGKRIRKASKISGYGNVRYMRLDKAKLSEHLRE